MDFIKIFLLLQDGIVQTLKIFFLTIIFSLPLGMLICLGRLSKFKPLAIFCKFFISILRGTPLMLQLLVVYFGPYFAFGISLKKLGSNWLFLSVIIGFSINYAAYFAEIFRSGIQSVSNGQYEAGKVLGMTKSQTFFLIVLQQVVRNVLPSITNEVINLVKDTSLAFAVNMVEMFTMAKFLAADAHNMLPYIVAAIIYYVFNLLVAFAMSYIEKKISKYSIK